MKDSLHEILSPALEKMASDAHAGSEKALESMLNRFMDGFGQAGEDQREMMNQSSKDVQQAVGQLGTQMTQFMDNLDDRSKDVEEQNQLQREQLETMLKDYEGQSDERQEKMAGQFDSLMQGITTGVNEQINTMQLSQKELGGRLESLLAYQQESHKQLYDEISSPEGVSTGHQC